MNTVRTLRDVHGAPLTSGHYTPGTQSRCWALKAQRACAALDEVGSDVCHWG